MRLTANSAMMLSLGVFCLLTAPAQGASFSLIPEADAFVSSSNPTNNYGGGGGLQVSAAGLPKGEFQSLLRFDLSAAKTSFDGTFGAGLWSVPSLVLQLTAGVPSNALFNASTAGSLAASWLQNDSWVEGPGTPMAPGGTGVTYNSLPSFLSGGDQTLGNFAFNGATSGATTYSLSLASGLLDDVSAGQLASLRLAAGDATMSGFFSSRSFTTAASRPILTITAVAIPEPSTWLLAILAAAGGYLVRRRLA